MNSNRIEMKLIFFKRYLGLCLLAGFVFLSGCNNDGEDVVPTLSDYQKSVIAYFKEIALGFEFGSSAKITRRWESDMSIYIGGNPNQTHLKEVDKIVSEINDLITIDVELKVVSDSTLSNYYIFFGSGTEYAQIFPNLSGLVSQNYGLFSIFWNLNNSFTRGYMYVDIVRANEVEQLHLLREELTQSLGLAKDSFLYDDSIFQQNFSTKVTNYSMIDKDLIRLLYHPRMKTGLSASEVESLLNEILLSENTM